MGINCSVKEKRNLVGFNIWSGTDYLGTVSNEQDSIAQFQSTKGLSSLQSSKGWSSNFEKSILQDYPADEYTQIALYNIDKNFTYTASVDLYSEVKGIAYFIARVSTSNTIIKNRSFNASNLKQTIALTINSDEFNNELNLYFRVFNLEQGKIYTDNWKLTYN